MKKAIWIGPTGFVSGIGTVETDKEVLLTTQRFETLKSQGLIKQPTKKKVNKNG